MKYSRSQREYRTLFREFHKDHGITYEFHIIEVELISNALFKEIVDSTQKRTVKTEIVSMIYL